MNKRQYNRNLLEMRILLFLYLLKYIGPQWILISKIIQMK